MMKSFLLSTVLLTATAVAAQRFATEDDMAKLEADLKNLEADLAATDADALDASERERVERIQEEVVYLKVKMRKHVEADGEGTGVSVDEVRDLRLDVADLRNDLRPYLNRPAASSGSVTLSAGTELALRLDDGLSSTTARPGDRFQASVMEPILKGNTVAIEAGSLFHGRVELVDRAGGTTDRTAKLVLALNELERGGQTYDVTATIFKASERLETGLGSETKKIGIGAGIGTILGAVVGGKKGAAIGAAVGGGGAILATEGKEVELPPGTILYVRLDRDLTLPMK